MTVFCSFHAILYAIGSLFISSTPKTSFNLRAITAREYESLHCPASSTLRIPPISPKLSLLYLYFAQPDVKITASNPPSTTPLPVQHPYLLVQIN